MDSIKKIFQENKFLFLGLFFLIPLLFLLPINTHKAIFLILLLTIWYILGKKYKDFTYVSFLILLFVLPFNITLQLDFFNTDPYVNGVFTNYLVPTLSILDFFVILLLISSILEKKLEQTSFTFDLFLLSIFAMLQSLLITDMVSLLGIMRIVIYLLAFRVIIKEVKIKGDVKFLRIVQLSILVQVSIALLQFSRGSSLGLNFLGESVFSAGMKGSNFIDLNGNLYIRGYGTFPHPNILSGWLISTLIILWKQKKGLIFMILASVGIILTFSRIGILLLGIFWVLFLIEGYIYKRKTGVFSFVPIVLERIKNLFVGGDMAVSDRISLLKSSLPVIKDNWIVGCGYNTFVREMGVNTPRTANGVLLNQPVHNLLLLSLSEMGIIGTLLLLYGYIKTFFQRKIQWRNIRTIYIFFIILIIGMFDHYLLSLPQGLLMGMILLFILPE